MKIKYKCPKCGYPGNKIPQNVLPDCASCGEKTTVGEVIEAMAIERVAERATFLFIIAIIILGCFYV